MWFHIWCNEKMSELWIFNENQHYCIILYLTNPITKAACKGGWGAKIHWQCEKKKKICLSSFPSILLVSCRLEFIFIQNLTVALLNSKFTKDCLPLLFCDYLIDNWSSTFRVLEAYAHSSMLLIAKLSSVERGIYPGMQLWGEGGQPLWQKGCQISKRVSRP